MIVRTTMLLVLLALSAACGRHEVTRDEWLAMTPRDRVLIVESLRGGEQASASKGGARRTHPMPTNWYVERIDDAYDQGDSRTVDALWAELAEDG